MKTLSESDRQSHLRTRLANERTLLAYVRTALGFLATGIAGLGFREAVHPAVGWGFIALGAVLIGFGFMRFVQTRNAAAVDTDEE